MNADGSTVAANAFMANSDIAMMVDPTVSVEAQVKAAGSSFYRAMRILAADHRAAMYAIYAFCREVDDIADEGGSRAEKIAGLENWREEIALLYAAAPRHVIARALAPMVTKFQLRQEDFLAIIDGMAMDAAADIIAPDEATLDLYCARVASAVGRLSVRAFGCTGEAPDAVAEHLGRALQLTNILRDLAEDAARNRLYLPHELLEKYGIPIGPPAAVLRHPELPRLCAELAARATDYFALARAALRRCPRYKMRAATLMLVTYQAILRRLQQRGWAAYATPVKLSKPAKLLLLLRYGLTG